ncbi:MAG: hypothetical protein ACK45U_09595 [bacterium]
MRLQSITRLEYEIMTQRQQLNHLRDEFLNRHINGETYQQLKTEIESKIYINELNLRDIQSEQTPIKKFLFDDVPMLKDLVDFYNQSNGVNKRNILSCIFSEKIHFDEKKDATIIYTKPIEVILSISDSLRGYKQKKQVGHDLFELFAPLIDESCSYIPMIQYATIRKLKN